MLNPCFLTRALLLPIVVVLVYIVALLLAGAEFTLQSVLADIGIR